MSLAIRVLQCLPFWHALFSVRRRRHRRQGGVCVLSFSVTWACVCWCVRVCARACAAVRPPPPELPRPGWSWGGRCSARVCVCVCAVRVCARACAAVRPPPPELPRPGWSWGGVAPWACVCVCVCCWKKGVCVCVSVRPFSCSSCMCLPPSSPSGVRAPCSLDALRALSHGAPGSIYLIGTLVVLRIVLPPVVHV